MNKEQLQGAWTLKSFLISNELGNKEWRSGAHGLLIYTLCGRMSVSINSKMMEASILDSLLFYAGTYQIDGSKIVHFVTNATEPSRIGKEMVREARLKGRVLTLTARGEFGKAELTWEKIS